MKKKQPELDALYAALESRFGPRVRLNETLAAHTTLRLGGPADLWFPARSASELTAAVALARQCQVPVFILGGGANLLIREAGIRGLVVGNRANAVRFAGNRVTAESGAILPRLAKQCAQHGLSGLEWAVGVPGTIGGATVNNAGAYGASLSDILVRAELLNPDGKRVWQPVEWFGYEYRSSKLKAASPAPQRKGKSKQSFPLWRERRGNFLSDLQGGGKSNKIPPTATARRLGERKHIILQVELALTSALRAKIEATMQKYTARRKVAQPPGATIGSMFKNPPGDYAGRLIEAAGLKGYRINQAQISPVHANFFINLSTTRKLRTEPAEVTSPGGGGADDMIELVQTAQKQVFDQFGVLLELEIEIV